MSDSERVIRVRKFPLEAEAIATMAQHELATLSHEELLKYSQQAVFVMSQLRHYCSEILHGMESRGFQIESDEG